MKTVLINNHTITYNCSMYILYRIGYHGITSDVLGQLYFRGASRDRLTCPTTGHRLDRAACARAAAAHVAEGTSVGCRHHRLQGRPRKAVRERHRQAARISTLSSAAFEMGPARDSLMRQSGKADSQAQVLPGCVPKSGEARQRGCWTPSVWTSCLLF